MKKLLKRLHCFFKGHALKEELLGSYGNQYTVIVRCMHCGMTTEKGEG